MHHAPCTMHIRLFVQSEGDDHELVLFSHLPHFRLRGRWPKELVRGRYRGWGLDASGAAAGTGDAAFCWMFSWRFRWRLRWRLIVGGFLGYLLGCLLGCSLGYVARCSLGCSRLACSVGFPVECPVGLQVLGLVCAVRRVGVVGSMMYSEGSTTCTSVSWRRMEGSGLCLI